MSKTRSLLPVVLILCLAGCRLPTSAAPTSTPRPQIAFHSDRDGNWEIYVMHPDGSDPTNLTQHRSSDRYPAWSPDGTRIAFQSDRDGNDEIYVMYADGSQATRLTRNKERDMMPAWSPDGERLSFSTDRDGGLALYVMNADGSGQERLIERKTVGGSSHWSPDGTQIVLPLLEAHYIGRIYVVGTDGSNLTPVTPYGTYRVAGPAWSPDGARIAFASEQGHQLEMDLYLMNADGSEPIRLTEDLNAGSPTWSPDGTRIAFSVRPKGGKSDIYCVDANGSNIVRLTEHQANDSSPSWSPIREGAND